MRLLSCNGLSTRPKVADKTQEEDLKKFYKLAQKTFFEPRLRTSLGALKRFSALLYVASCHVRSGRLQSIHAVKRYLAAAALVSLSPEQFARTRLLTFQQGGIPRWRYLRTVYQVDHVG